jgi:hypothetical protein
MTMEIKLDLIADDRLCKLTPMEKIRLILDSTKMGNIIVLEKGLTPEEETTLIETAMNEFSSEFIGVEIESYPYRRKSILGRFFGRPKPTLTLIGPAKKLKTVRKDKDLISVIYAT